MGGILILEMYHSDDDTVNLQDVIERELETKPTPGSRAAAHRDQKVKHERGDIVELQEIAKKAVKRKDKYKYRASTYKNAYEAQKRIVERQKEIIADSGSGSSRAAFAGAFFALEGPV